MANKKNKCKICEKQIPKWRHTKLCSYHMIGLNFITCFSALFNRLQIYLKYVYFRHKRKKRNEIY